MESRGRVMVPVPANADSGIQGPANPTPCTFPIFFCSDCSSHFTYKIPAVHACAVVRAVARGTRKQACSILFKLYFNISLSG